MRGKAQKRRSNVEKKGGIKSVQNHLCVELGHTVQPKGEKRMQVWIIVAAVLIGLGCSQHQTTRTVEADTSGGVRTGKVQNVVIADTVAPDTLTVRAGDEVRWLNQRQKPVTIVFAEQLDGKVSCHSGFTKLTGIDNSATLKPDESVALCFNRLGTIRYMVSSDTDDDLKPMRDSQGTVSVR
jgi:plastocyanin